MPTHWIDYITGSGRYYTQQQQAKHLGVPVARLSYWMVKCGIKPITREEALAELRELKGIQ